MSFLPAFMSWRNAKKSTDIERSTIGHSIRDVEVPAARVRTHERMPFGDE